MLEVNEGPPSTPPTKNAAWTQYLSAQIANEAYADLVHEALDYGNLVDASGRYESLDDAVRLRLVSLLKERVRQEMHTLFPNPPFRPDVLEQIDWTEVAASLSMWMFRFGKKRD